MNFDKNISLGINLDLSIEDYKKIFDIYKNNIKEIYFSVPIMKKYIHSRTIILEQYKKEENLKKIISILYLAEKYNIDIELAINSTFNINEEDIKNMYYWCKENNIKISKIVTLNNIVDICYKYFGNIEYCYSYNNNIINDNFLNDINKLFSEIVIGNRNLRNIKLFKKIHEKKLKIKLLLDNGCQHNCLWCSSGNAGLCNYIAKKNSNKYSINFLMAIQSVFPFEVEKYYSKFKIDSYKLATRVCDKDVFYNTLNYYIHNKEIQNINEFIYTSKLNSLFNIIEDKKKYINFFKIKKIKEKIWEDIINEKKNINSSI